MHEKLKMIYCGIMDYVYIPEWIKKNNEKKLLHISDTPINFFDALKKLLKELSPNIIIHTGDMVDNIKLEFYKHQLPRYEYHLKLIMDILESSGAEEIYLCAGNHDNVRLMHKYARISTVIENSSNIEVFSLKASISHYPCKIIQNPADYNFYGHDTSLGNDIVNNKIYLNGVSSINILTAETKKIFHLPYPYNVNDARLMKGKIGL